MKRTSIPVMHRSHQLHLLLNGSYLLRRSRLRPADPKEGHGGDECDGGDGEKAGGFEVAERFERFPTWAMVRRGSEGEEKRPSR